MQCECIVYALLHSFLTLWVSRNRMIEADETRESVDKDDGVSIKTMLQNTCIDSF